VLPFRGDSMAELMFKISNDQAPDIRVIRKELPESLARLVALSLSKRPELRYQNGDQFAADLRTIIVSAPARDNSSEKTVFIHGNDVLKSSEFEKTVLQTGLSAGSAGSGGLADTEIQRPNK